MADSSPFDIYRTDYIRFGKNEGRVTDVFERKQNNRNPYGNSQKKQNTEDEAKKSDFVDRSDRLNATLNSLALFNMANLRRLGRKTADRIDRIDAFIDGKLEAAPETHNPFIRRLNLIAE